MTLKLNGSSSGHVNLDAKAAAASNTLTLPDTANGELVAADSSGHINLADNKEIKLGTGGDLVLKHDGSNSYIKDTGTGALVINSNDFRINNAGQTENMITATENADISLYYNNEKQFSTTATGVEIHDNGTNIARFIKDFDGTSGGSLMVGPAAATHDTCYLGNKGNAGTHIYRPTDQGDYGVVHCYSDVGGTRVGKAYIQADGDYIDNSDYRLKENITLLTDGIATVKKLKPSTFTWKGESKGTKKYGFIAHEVQEVIPDIVTGTKDGTVEKDGKTVPDYQNLSKTSLIAVLTKALQEAITEIETLKTKVAALEGS